MPQHQLIPTEAAVTGLVVDISERNGPNQTGFHVRVKQTWSTGVTATVFAKDYTGLLVDLLTDLSLEATSAFLFGERGDIQRACATNWKAARAHQERYEQRPSPEPF